VSEPHDSGRNFDAAPMQALYSKNEIKLTKELGLFFIVTFTIEIVTAFVTVFVTLKKKLCIKCRTGASSLYGSGSIEIA
jgi:hypothetical protein